jgi:hypothetical protein
MKAPDKDKFCAGKEFGAMIQSEIVEIIPLSEVRGSQAVPSSLKKRRRVLTREIYKWKARMNLDGSKHGKESTTIRHMLQ